ncbi:Hypothetical predicted protein [Paramuricea clavata]|uniref:VWFA domain-containing protein n=1 Tax=Paramuricea clavata TaxID=317549 RepID=A0A6S7GHV4_PARCT|nr:Hypothetical predicted protein [Paramuricea clavata]
MSLTGILLDVSGSMQRNIGSGTDEEGGSWVQSIFNVIDDLIEHDLTSENRVFAIGVGAECPGKEIFDVIATLQQFENTNMPVTEDHINEILDILERNGARNIRNWACNVKLIQDVLSEYMATLTLREFESDEHFVKKFMDHFLPPGFQDTVPTAPLAGGVLSGLKKVANIAENATISYERGYRRSCKKAKCYLEDGSRILKDVGTHSIFTVQDASRIIIRGCVGEKELNELSNERKQELLENVKLFIYGKTPLYESLEKAIKLFEEDTSGNKLLFVLSDGEPTDGSNEDIHKINKITSKLREAGVKIVSCLVSGSTNIHPKRLYDTMPPGWEPGAKFLFSLSSEVRTQDLVARAVLVKRGWTIDIAKNETKLFMQVNHPDNLREACEVARNVVCSSDALSELLVSVDLDIYINRITSAFRAKDQREECTCYAFASAVVLHLAMHRVHGLEEGCPSFDELKDEIIDAYGKMGADTSQVLEKMCRNKQWDAFGNFYDTNPTGILTQNELDVRECPTSPPPRTFGYAVVLTSYNSKCLTFMNSWGEEWANNGFFRVKNADVLGDQLEFFDVDDLSEGEKEHCHQHGSEVATKLMKSLKGLQKAEYICPECQQTSLVTEFTGTLSKVQCPKCLREFSTSANAGNILALNVYLTSLSR